MKVLNQERYKKLLDTLSSLRNDVNDKNIRMLLDNCISLTIDSLELHNALLEKYVMYVKNGVRKHDKATQEMEMLLERADNVNKDDLVAIGLLQFEFTMKISVDELSHSASNLSFEHYTSMINAATQSLFETYEGITQSKSKSYLKLLAEELVKLEPVGKASDIVKKIIDINAIESIEIKAADVALLKWRTYCLDLFRWCSNCNLIIRMINHAINHQDSIKNT